MLTNDVKVVPGDEDVTITPQRKNGRPRHMCTVMLSNVMFMGEQIFGELVDEFTFPRQPDLNLMINMTPVLHRGEQFEIWTGNDDDGSPVYESLNFKSFEAAYIIGSTVYVSKV